MAGADPGKVSNEAKKRGIDRSARWARATTLPRSTWSPDLRPRGRRGLRPAPGPGSGADPLRQPRAGPPGLHRLHRGVPAASRKYGIDLPDRQLVCAPLESPEGQDYLGAMIAPPTMPGPTARCSPPHRQAFEEVLAGKLETGTCARSTTSPTTWPRSRRTDRRPRRHVCVHRKGATRAFGPGHPDVPDDYRAIGQPVLVPGSMGTAS